MLNMKNQNQQNNKPKNIEDLGFMHRKNAAMLMRESSYTRAIIWISFFFLISLIVWLYYAKIDRMTRGSGKVVPTLNIQYVQSYDGGIISKIFAHEEDLIYQGDAIVKINDSDFQSRLLGGEADITGLTAKRYRLLAESTEENFECPASNNKKLLDKCASEKKLYATRKNTLGEKMSILKEKIIQKNTELKTIAIEIQNLEQAHKLSTETMDIAKNMLKHKVISRMQYNEKQQQLNNITGNLKTKKSLIPKIHSEIKVLENEAVHLRLAFIGDSREKLEEISSKLERLNEAKKIDKGRIHRAIIKSPINGIVKKMYYSTVGGVVKPGGIVAEIVPTEEHLLIDTKILPSKIAFIFEGQAAVIRFSAYDFAIYGSIQGKVVSISADTIIDEIDKKHYYTVKIKTERNFLTKGGKRLPIKIGMVAIVDIINGKQSILDYILNPIIKAKQNMLSDN